VAAVAEEEAGVDGDGGNRQSAVSTVAVATGRVESGGDLESDGDLESFEMKIETTRGGLLFIDSKISTSVLV
jgi:hypothetical protein